MSGNTREESAYTSVAIAEAAKKTQEAAVSAKAPLYDICTNAALPLWMANVLLLDPDPVVVLRGLKPAICSESPEANRLQLGIIHCVVALTLDCIRKKQVVAVAFVQHVEAVESVQEADWPAERLLDMEQPADELETLTDPPLVELDEDEEEEAAAEEDDEDAELDACRGNTYTSALSNLAREGRQRSIR